MRYQLIFVFLLLSIVTGCGSTIEGTWYSDRDDQSKLTLTKEGTYTDGTWLTSGEYSVEDNEITLTSTLDGTNTLKILTIDKDKLLFYGSGEDSHIYYDNKKAAVTARQASKQTKAEQRAKAERKAIETSLIGYWYSEIYPIEFTEFNSYKTYAKHGTGGGEYKVLSPDSISIFGWGITGELNWFESTAKIKLDGDHLTFLGVNYYKAKRLDLSLDLLEGEWTDGTSTVVFTKEDDDTGIMTSLEFIDNKTASFSANSRDEIYVREQQESIRAFLSETETEYQLLLAERQSPETHTVLLRKKKVHKLKIGF